VRRLVVAVVLSAAFGAVVALSLAPSVAQEAEGEPRAQLVAAVDVSPITLEIGKLRAELAAVREAVADEKGLRGDVARATAAVEALQAQLKELNEGFRKYADATQPVIAQLAPVRRWDYYVLRSRSESVTDRLGREGWELVTASNEWLYFRRPLREEEPGKE